jgi:Protein of unknown function (DUF2934)
MGPGRLEPLRQFDTAGLSTVPPLSLQPQGGAVLQSEKQYDQAERRRDQKKSTPAWEKNGKPEGREDEFWHLAEQELRNEDKSSPLRTPDTL